MSAPVLLIHGLMGSLRLPDLGSMLAPLASSAPDLLGYGEHAAWPESAITLEAQLAHLRDAMDRLAGPGGRVQLVGHSIGGVLAACLADAWPERVECLVSIEGNFSLKDAFWSSSVARMDDAQLQAMQAERLADPAAWLALSGISSPDAQRLYWARQWLGMQPVGTLRAMARAIVARTGAADYPALLQRVFARQPVYLLAGERSRAGWDVPDWALKACAGQRVMAGCGHLMMLEQPETLAAQLRDWLQA